MLCMAIPGPYQQWHLAFGGVFAAAFRPCKALYFLWLYSLHSDEKICHSAALLQRSLDIAKFYAFYGYVLYIRGRKCAIWQRFYRGLKTLHIFMVYMAMCPTQEREPVPSGRVFAAVAESLRSKIRFRNGGKYQRGKNQRGGKNLRGGKNQRGDSNQRVKTGL